MAELCRFYGMIIRMFFDDALKRHKPHIRVVCAEYEAAVGLDGEILSGDLPLKQIKLLQAWIILHEDELYAEWTKAVRHEQLGKIEPLA
jgi:hypothetical protein